MAEIIVALDVPDGEAALELVDRIGGGLDFVKVGLELFSREGPAIVARLQERGLRIFLDLKVHDIPNTAAGAVRSAATLGVDLLTVHASGGRRMLEAAANAKGGSLEILGVTVLTSLGPSELAEAWGRERALPGDEVVRLAEMATEAGLDGVVASALEVSELRSRLGPGARIVTPGIRLAGGGAHDQTRIATPEAAVRAGASHLVLGRAVTRAPDPAGALAAVRNAIRPGAEAVR